MAPAGGGLVTEKQRGERSEEKQKGANEHVEAHRWFIVMTKWLSPVCSAAISRSIAHQGRALDNSTVKDVK